jgi:HJR/Mrr/RecB family endonuclease
MVLEYGCYGGYQKEYLLGSLISLFVQLFMLLVSVTLSLTMTLINLIASLARQGGRRPARRRSGTRGGASGIAVGVVVLVVFVLAEPRLAGVLIVVGVVGLLVWLLIKGSGRYRTLEASELASLFQNVRQMSGPQFEVFVANLFRAMGYDAQVLGGSGDQGVDVLVKTDGKRIAVQCKNYSKAVGNKPVQEVYAGATYHQCSQAWVVAPAGYTKGAVELSRRVGVLLYDASSIRSWIGQVEAAARMREQANTGAAANGASGTETVHKRRAVWYPHPDDEPPDAS